MTTGNLKLAFILEAVDRATAPLQRINRTVDRLTEPARRVRASFGALLRETRFDRVRSAWGDLAERGDALLSWGRGAATMLFGLGAAGTAAWFGLGRVIDRVDQARDMAATLGIAFEDFQRFGFAAQQNASSQEEAGMALQFLATNMAAAISGSKEAATWFARVGISVEQLRKMTALQVFEAIADRFHGIADAGGNAERKIAFMRATMGRSGAGLKQMLDLGSDALRRFYREADTLGGVVSGQAGEAMADFNDQVDKTKFSLFGLAAAVARGALPVLNDLVRRVIAWSTANRELIATRVAEFMERILPRLPEIASALGSIALALGGAIVLADRFAQVLGGWETVFAVITGVVIAKGLLALVALKAAIWGVGVALLTTPFGWMLAGVSALIAGAALLIKHWEPVKKFFTDLWESIGQFFDRFGTNMMKPAAGAPSIYAGPDAWARYRAGDAAPTMGGAGQRTELGGTLRIEIGADGRPRVGELSKDAGSPLDFDVYAGTVMGVR